MTDDTCRVRLEREDVFGDITARRTLDIEAAQASDVRELLEAAVAAMKDFSGGEVFAGPEGA